MINGRTCAIASPAHLHGRKWLIFRHTQIPFFSARRRCSSSSLENPETSEEELLSPPLLRKFGSESAKTDSQKRHSRQDSGTENSARCFAVCSRDSQEHIFAEDAVRRALPIACSVANNLGGLLWRTRSTSNLPQGALPLWLRSPCRSQADSMSCTTGEGHSLFPE